MQKSVVDTLFRESTGPRVWFSQSYMISPSVWVGPNDSLLIEYGRQMGWLPLSMSSYRRAIAVLLVLPPPTTLQCPQLLIECFHEESCHIMCCPMKKPKLQGAECSLNISWWRNEAVSPWTKLFIIWKFYLPMRNWILLKTTCQVSLEADPFPVDSWGHSAPSCSLNSIVIVSNPNPEHIVKTCLRFLDNRNCGITNITAFSHWEYLFSQQ